MLVTRQSASGHLSRSLAETESNYGNTECELLVIVFAAEQFHQYIFGRQVLVISDHKPLETILKKPLQ
ncbi:hypothetical protein RRG08_051299 [Elysia crispata]|uniref:Reverse transcriptase RNase H-like domain-containing protein n=1 Tax=Elysia crispata TaxID=231223 RepID=A0AAE0XTD5_9GAST|nr:hypothetical protein RRG08_051299 [Elysia crispata]